jgi:uncharacterized membrane protein YkoI
MNKSLLLLTVLALLPVVPAQASPRNPQDQARKELRAGRIMKSSEIEQIVIPQMPGWQYLGFDYDPAAFAYRLKFIRDGHVVFVDVDARSGEVIRQMR